MNDNEKIEASKPAEAEQSPKEADGKSEPDRPTRGLEGFYEHFRGVPLKYLDLFIAGCFAVLIAVIVFGVIKAKG